MFVSIVTFSKAEKMTISNSVKASINKAFVGIVFFGRDVETLLKTFNTKVRGSDNVSIILPIDRLEVETIDETHDKVVIIYDDYKVEGVITWRPTTRNIKGYVFVRYE